MLQGEKRRVDDDCHDTAADSQEQKPPQKPSEAPMFLVFLFHQLLFPPLSKKTPDKAKRPASVDCRQAISS